MDGRIGWKFRYALRATGVVVSIVTLRVECALAQNSPHGEKLKVACEECHDPSDWKEVSLLSKFDHSHTGFALTGQHAQVDCKQCHSNLVFTKTSTACADCHQDVHRAELGNACERCHTSKSWLVPDMAQRHNNTRFSLVGPHFALPCQACHVNEQKYEFVNIQIDCVGCHRSTYDATSNPPHRANGLGTNCQDCHSLTALRWAGSFNHDLTGFPLTGAHQAVACSQCHASPQFAAASTACYGCHTDAATNRTTPVPHTNFPTDCKHCHDTQTWTDVTTASVPHNPPLTGAHVTVTDCNACHNGNYTNTSQACYSCHQPTMATATTPVPHTGFPTDCSQCHTTNPGWTPSTFSHASITTGRFPQDSRHPLTNCAKCHQTSTDYTKYCCQSSGCHGSCAGGG